MVRSSSFDNNGVKKGAWTKDEDNKLRAYIQRYGHWNWTLLPKFAGVSRSGKSCRLRWMNYLRPNMKHGNFAIEEDDLVIELHNKLGNKWSKIAEKLPGRSDNEIKNRWNTHLKKRFQKSHNISANKHVATLETDHANPEVNPSNRTDLDVKQEGVSSESSSYSSPTETSSYQLSSTDCDFTPNIFDDELSGNFWTEPFLQDIDAVTQSEDNLLSPYNYVNEDYFTSQSSCHELMMSDENLWSLLENLK